MDVSRRSFLKFVGLGAAGLGVSLAAPELILPQKKSYFFYGNGLWKYRPKGTVIPKGSLLHSAHHIDGGELKIQNFRGDPYLHLPSGPNLGYQTHEMEMRVEEDVEIIADGKASLVYTHPDGSVVLAQGDKHGVTVNEGFNRLWLWC